MAAGVYTYRNTAAVHAALRFLSHSSRTFTLGYLLILLFEDRSLVFAGNGNGRN